MEAQTLHAWTVTPREAIALQRELAPLVVREGVPADVRVIAGTDISVSREGRFRAAVVALRWPELEPVEQALAEGEVPFPYVPGLLSFREIPALLPAFAALTVEPDLIVVDGQGIAHPRRIGLAAHLGLVLDRPAIGCAKSLLTGRPAGELAPERGARVPLVDHEETVGYALRTRANVNPVYVSTGHRVGGEEAAAWVLALARGYRLPEPTRLAHKAAAGQPGAPLTHVAIS